MFKYDLQMQWSDYDNNVSQIPGIYHETNKSLPKKLYIKVKNCPDPKYPNAADVDNDNIAEICYQNIVVPPPIPPKTQGDPCNGIGNPCNPSTGNKYQKETDYAGNNSQLSFTRHYNSGLATVDSGMGYGWVHQWAANIDVSSSKIFIQQTDGRGEPFTKTNNLWQGDTDTRLALTQDSIGYILSNDNGTVERYDLNGNLLSKTDLTGKQTQYQYNAADQLITVLSPFGHSLQFSYNTDERIESVVTPKGEIYQYQYDSTGNLVKVIYPDDSFKQYHYENTDSPHALTGITDENTARYATFAYSFGKAILTQHAETDNNSPQEKFALSYDSNTQTTVTDAIGTVEVFTFAENLNDKKLLSRINQTDGKGISRSYDANNNLISSTDPEGKVTEYSYNASNQKISKTEAAGTSSARTTEYKYVSAQLDLVTETRNPSVKTGQYKVTQLEYNSNNTVKKTTQKGFRADGSAISRITSYKYNNLGQVTEINSPLSSVNDITTLSYYECTTGGKCGQLASVSNALNQTTHYDSYDANGRITQITSPLNLITTYSYDLRGRLASMTQTPPQGQGAPRITQYSYDQVGQLATLTTSDGKILTYSYDAAHNLRSITDNLGNRIAYSYDLKGNRTIESGHNPDDTLVRTLQTEYDHRNRVKTLNSAGSITQLINDAVGNLVTRTDPNQNPTTTHSYDPLHRLQQTIDALGNPTDYQYDTNDRLIQVKAPNDATTDYLYDDLGNQLEESGADRGSILYSHDSAGNITSRTDARDITTLYQYDQLNRVTVIDYPGTEEDIRYSYDNCLNGIGQLCKVTDQSGITEYQYDNFGNRTQQLKTEQTDTQKIKYHYDAADRLISQHYPSDRIVNFHRNSIGQVDKIEVENQGVTMLIADTIHYRADGLITSLSYGNGRQETRSYDDAGRLSCKQLNNLPEQCYQYDANGNILNIDQQANDSTYGYDSLDRLILANKNNQQIEYGLDSNGNRTDKQVDANNESYTTAQESNQLLNRVSNNNTHNYSYDASGNITNDGQNQYHYGANNRLTKVTRGSSTIAQYTYNAQGQRSSKMVGGIVTHYLYDQSGRLISELNASNHTTKDYFFLNDQLIAFQTNEQDGDNDGIADHQDNCSQHANPRQIDSDNDGFGNLCDIDLNNSGGNSNTLDLNLYKLAHRSRQGNANYRPDADFNSDGHINTLDLNILKSLYRQPIGPGATTASPNNSTFYIHNDHLSTPQTITDQQQKIVWQAVYTPFGQATVITQDVVNNVRFPGQYFDEETGLHYNYHRYYDPSTGRYITSDPIGLAGGLNTYAYAGGNPLKYTDPTGLLITAIRIEFSDNFIILHQPDDTGQFCSTPDTYDGYQFLGVHKIINPPCIFLCFFSDKEWESISIKTKPEPPQS